MTWALFKMKWHWFRVNCKFKFPNVQITKGSFAIRIVKSKGWWPSWMLWINPWFLYGKCVSNWRRVSLLQAPLALETELKKFRCLSVNQFSRSSLNFKVQIMQFLKHFHLCQPMPVHLHGRNGAGAPVVCQFQPRVIPMSPLGVMLVMMVRAKMMMKKNWFKMVPHNYRKRNRWFQRFA